jgi:hypothetical protein
MFESMFECMVCTKTRATLILTPLYTHHALNILVNSCMKYAYVFFIYATHVHVYYIYIYIHAYIHTYIQQIYT